MINTRCLILVCFSHDLVRSALAFASLVPADQFVFVANSQESFELATNLGLSDKWLLLKGSNSNCDFSGFQEGLDMLNNRNLRYSQYVFCNDTVLAHRRFTYLRYVLFRMSIKFCQSGVIGFYNSFGRSYALSGIPADGWLSTYLFCMNVEALSFIHWRVDFGPIVDAYVVGGTDEKAFFSRELDYFLRGHLCNWLFEGGWYKSEKLNSLNSDMFKVKAKAILSEKFLSSKFIESKIKLNDVFFRISVLYFFDKLLSKSQFFVLN